MMKPEILYKNIRRLRKEKGLSQDELARLTGYKDRSSIAKIEAGKVDLSQSKIAAFARALDTTPSDLMGLADEPIIDLPQGKRIPIIGDVACGSPIYHPGDGDEMVTVYDFDQADCAVRARGDSMEPLIQDGDLVMIHSQPMVDDGQIAAVVVDDEVTLKRVYYEPGRLLILSALNPDYGPITISGPDIDQTCIIGRAIGKQARW